MDVEELIREIKEWPRVCAEYENSIDQLLDRAADALEKLSRENNHSTL